MPLGSGGRKKRGGIGFGNKRSIFVGLHAAQRRLRFACIDAQQPSGYVVKLAERPLPSGLIQQGRVADAANFTDELRVMVDEEHMMRARTVLCVTLQSSSVFVKRFGVPKASLESVLAGLPSNKSISQQIQDPDNTVIQAAILNEDVEQGTVMPIVAVVARRDVIEARQAAGIESGLLIEAVDVDAIAIYNCFARCLPQAASEISLLVHVGDEGSLIVVSDKFGPVVARQTPVGLEQLVESVAASQGGITEDAVWQMLVDGRADMEHWAESIDLWVSKITDTVRQTVGSLRTRQQIPVAGYICGDALAIPGLSDAFLDAMKGSGFTFNVRLFNPLDSLGVDDAVGLRDNLEGTAYTLTLGMALRQLET